MPVGAFKFLIGSPPYFGANIKYCVDIPWLQSWEKYCKVIETYIREAYRIMPDGGGIIINIDDIRGKDTGRYYYHTELVRKTCLDLGMYDAGVICWSKQNVTGKKHAKGSNQRLVTRPNHEYILAFFKGRPNISIPSFVYGEANYLTLSTWLINSDVEEINSRHWEMFDNFWSVAPASHPDHPAVYPAELAYRMLTRFTGAGDIVCDPWVGVGTSVVQCILTGRRFIGIDKGKGFANEASTNVAKAYEAADELTTARLRRIEDYLKSCFSGNKDIRVA